MIKAGRSESNLRIQQMPDIKHPHCENVRESLQRDHRQANPLQKNSPQRKLLQCHLRRKLPRIRQRKKRWIG
jgi:hypothetical protein